MDSLLTITSSQFLTVETMFRAAFLLPAMGSLLLILSAGAVSPNLRLPLFTGGVALAATAWLEHGVLASWHGAFEPAGMSYCVTGLPVDDAARVLAWAIGVPALLMSLGMARIPWGARGGYLLEQNSLVLLIMGVVSLFTSTAGFALILWSGYLSCIRITAHAPPSSRSQGFIAFGAVTLGMIIRALGSLHFLPTGGDTATRLVSGEFYRTFADMLCLVVPALVLLVRVVSRNASEAKASGE